MNWRRIYWACQIAGWGAYSGLGVWSTAEQVGWRPGMVAGYALFFAYSIALTDLMRREILRRRWLDDSLGRMLRRLFLSAVAVGAIQTFLVVTIDTALQPDSKNGFLKNPKFALALWLGVTGVTIAWTVLYVALTASRRSREKEVHYQLALREAELRAIEAQINPHFLFNCLNSIRALVVENAPQAQDMITRLANIMRYNLHRDPNHTVPLATEVDIVSDYLALEATRLEDRLRVRFEIDPAANGAAIPPMLLQTLVENAVKHGISPRPAGGELVIRASLNHRVLQIEVENTGHLSGPKPGSTQFGLSNIRERLRILYGGDARLELENRGDDRVTATVLIPGTA